MYTCTNTYIYIRSDMYIYICKFLSINIFVCTYIQDSKRCENSYNIIVYII